MSDGPTAMDRSLDDRRAGRAYPVARALADLPPEQARRQLRQALARAPGSVSLHSMALWRSLLQHTAGEGTIRSVNRLLALSGVADRLVTRDNAFSACVNLRGAALQPANLPRFLTYATLAHGCGMIACWTRFGMPLAVEHGGDSYVLRLGDRSLAFAVSGPHLRFHFDFFFGHEPGIFQWLADFAPEDVFLDVGANVGTFSILAAGLRGCRAVGLEPFPVNVAAAEANVAANGLQELVTILPVAAADRSGRGRLSYESEVAGVSSQAFHPADRATAVDTPEMTAEGATIDDLVAEGRIPFPTRVKIDVDGGEEAVIAGMRRTLADPRLRSLRMEIHWWEPGKRALVDVIRRAGFKAGVADAKRNLLFTRP